ncbi:unnamed protein product [Fraxinus pennsylvanica]|uniref:X8 domain-containing protein n=1 Tax=Fraxinus pennsylvanica TaxID=56036 RepID=A0AAD1YWX4_9LAMI|nr:unnamed protein product [Fraxinus pennsylvanica]
MAPASAILTWVLSFFFYALVVVHARSGGGAAEELWCVAKNNAADNALQSSLDWACGPGGANCGPIQKVVVHARSGGGAAEELWCVAKNNAADNALQSSLDWACGPGGANCGPIQKGGPCNDPSDLQRTASFAFNDYFLKHGLTEESCSFSNTAALTSLNPSHNNCKFPSSSLSTSNGTFTGSVTEGPAIVNLNSSRSITRGWGRGLIEFLLFFVITLAF